jgi:hypothetical protein
LGVSALGAVVLAGTAYVRTVEVTAGTVTTCEEAVEARTVALQLIPAGATRRVDAEANPNCAF